MEDFLQCFSKRLIAESDKNGKLRSISRGRGVGRVAGACVRRDGRAVEGARLESAYTSKGYRGFESHSLRGD